MECHHSYKIPKHPSLILLCLGLLVIPGAHILGQNLVPNPGFEAVYDCDEFLDCSFGDESPCPPWLCINSENYFNSCSTIPAFDVPYNFRGFQFAHGGEGYAGGYQRDSREFLRVELTEPLVAGTCYTASMYINLAGADQNCAITNLGMLFTLGDPGWPVGESPQVEGTGQYYSDTANWDLITGSFIAFGGEDFLTIGNFYTNQQTPYHPDCAPFAWFSYYYFDDILVEESTTEVLDVDLGGPYEQCDFVILEPPVQGDFDYLWSDGSTSPNLIVTASGTYSVTVYDHASCSAGIGSADVVVLGSLPVDLGPDTVICTGSTHTITLDENLGNYVWSNGSTLPEFTIDEPGTYAVTFDDGCDITIDHIVVSYIDSPQFTLGQDTILCPGETYWLLMDPELGDFLWDNNSNASSYFFDEPGLYGLTISNQCGDYSDQIEIVYVDPPLFDLGPDSIVFCSGTTIELTIDSGLGNFVWQDGSTESNFMITSTGFYSLTVSNPCGVLTDEIYAEQIQMPVVVLGGSVELCPGESEILDPGENYGDYVWQDGSTEQVYVANTSGVYSVTVTNPCGADDASIEVEVAVPIVAPDLGPDVNLCPGDSLILSVEGQGANIIWNDLSMNDSLLVTNSGMYFVSVSTFCDSYADTVIVTVQNNPPSVALPEDFALCQNQSVILDPDITQVSFLWNDGSTLPQLAVNAPGVYAVTVSNACGTDADTVTVFNGGLPPEVFLGQDTSICPGQSITIHPTYSNVTNWSWPDGSDTTYFNTSSTGLVIVVASNDCGIAYDTMEISSLPAVPVLDLGQDTTICPGNALTLLIQIPDVTISWPDGTQGSTFIIADSGQFMASVTNACGSSMDTIAVGILPGIPNLDLGPDQDLCPGEEITIDPGITGVQYQWYDGSVNPTLTTDQPGTITLMISNECGNSIDSMIIEISTYGPQLDLGPDIYACVGSSVIIPSGILGVNYLWHDGSTDETYVTTSSGSISLTVQNLCGSASDTIVVDMSGLPPSVFLGTDTVLCMGSVLELISMADTSTVIQWQDGSSEGFFIVGEQGVYYLLESNQCGTDSDTITVEFVNLPPQVNLGADTTLCVGATLTLQADADSLSTWIWQDGSTEILFEVLASGFYYLTETNACGIDQDSISILINGIAPSPDLGQDTTLCEGSILLLTAEPGNGVVTNWQDGTSGLSYVVETAGTYSLSQFNTCGEGKDTMQVSYLSPPAPFELGPDTVICDGESFFLMSPVTHDFIEWHDGSTLSFYQVDQSGIYTLTISNQCGTESDVVEIFYSEAQIHFNIPEQVLFCAGDIVQLDATQALPAEYLWSTGSSQPFITITTPGSYFVTVKTECAEATHIVDVEEHVNCKSNVEFFVPNVFSPNGDQINDEFILVTGPATEILKSEAIIYDRWGGIMYKSDSVPFSWDGRRGGQPVLPGVYVYSVAIEYLFQGKTYTEVLSGDVTVLK